jgi:hypothetical protein
MFPFIFLKVEMYMVINIVLKNHDFSIKLMLLSTWKYDSRVSTHCLVSSKWIIMNNYYLWIPSTLITNEKLFVFYGNLKLRQYKKTSFHESDPTTLRFWGYREKRLKKNLLWLISKSLKRIQTNVHTKLAIVWF